MYKKGDYDLAGFSVGAVERTQILPRQALAGDVMIGIASSGPHANGYSLIRKIIGDSAAKLEKPAPFDHTRSLGDALLEPTRIYIDAVLPHLRNSGVRGFAHITGGGLADNVPRVLSENVMPAYDEAALSLPPVFEWLRSEGKVSQTDMRRTFNLSLIHI